MNESFRSQIKDNKSQTRLCRSKILFVSNQNEYDCVTVSMRNT
jgi:hypothetical protein